MAKDGTGYSEDVEYSQGLKARHWLNQPRPEARHWKQLIGIGAC